MTTTAITDKSKNSISASLVCDITVFITFLAHFYLLFCLLEDTNNQAERVPL